MAPGRMSFGKGTTLARCPAERTRIANPRGEPERHSDQKLEGSHVSDGSSRREYSAVLTMSRGSSTRSVDRNPTDDRVTLTAGYRNQIALLL